MWRQEAGECSSRCFEAKSRNGNEPQRIIVLLLRDSSGLGLEALPDSKDSYTTLGTDTRSCEECHRNEHSWKESTS